MAREQEPLILAVETATRAGGVSLAAGATVLCSSSGDPSASHSTNLIESIDEVLRAADVSLNDVDLFAAAVGPGSFTGLRIGLATVKGFAVCLDRKCVGVSTLTTIAHAAGTSVRTVALLPAGRGEVFAQLFSVDGNGALEPADKATHLGPSAVLEKYGRLRFVSWAGEGSQFHADLLRAWAECNGISFVDGSIDSNEAPTDSEGSWILAAPRAKLAESVSALAFHEYELGRLISPDQLQAIYVRPSDAETNEEWHEQKPPSAARL
jgi:tRNA threonylcarbamoyladenosine biosynthesis protein TsaB